MEDARVEVVARRRDKGQLDYGRSVECKCQGNLLPPDADPDAEALMRSRAPGQNKLCTSVGELERDRSDRDALASAIHLRRSRSDPMKAGGRSSSSEPPRAVSPRPRPPTTTAERRQRRYRRCRDRAKSPPPRSRRGEAPTKDRPGGHNSSGCASLRPPRETSARFPALRSDVERRCLLVIVSGAWRFRHPPLVRVCANAPRRVGHPPGWSTGSVHVRRRRRRAPSEVVARCVG